MSSVFKVHRTIREIFLKILENHSLEQLNKIPEGFSNNIIWNAAHCIAAQQALVYKLSGLTPMVSDDFMNKYKKGTKPDGDVSQAEVDEVKALLSSTLQQTEQDYNNAVFNNYMAYTTSMGNELTNVEEALDFVNYHEGMHTGIVMSIRKFV